MTDKIFLLSVEEYEKYKDKIPPIRCWWWMRSPVIGSYKSAVIGSYKSASVHGGNVYLDGDYVYNGSGAVRPALVIPKDYKIGERVLAYDFPWIVIDKGLAIAEVPVGFECFDKEFNDYEKSKIRQWLLDWIQERI